MASSPNAKKEIPAGSTATDGVDTVTKLPNDRQEEGQKEGQKESQKEGQKEGQKEASPVSSTDEHPGPVVVDRSTPIDDAERDQPDQGLIKGGSRTLSEELNTVFGGLMVEENQEYRNASKFQQTLILVKLDMLLSWHIAARISFLIATAVALPFQLAWWSLNDMALKITASMRFLFDWLKRRIYRPTEYANIGADVPLPVAEPTSPATPTAPENPAAEHPKTDHATPEVSWSRRTSDAMLNHLPCCVVLFTTVAIFELREWERAEGYLETITWQDVLGCNSAESPKY